VAVGNESEESVFIPDAGNPSPGQLTADKVSFSLFSKYMRCSAKCTFVSFAVTITVHVL